MKAKDIDTIIVHCTASKAKQVLHASQIDKMHRELGWKCIGYHYVVLQDGTIEKGRPDTMEGAHCNLRDARGISYNKHSIGIVYVGGLSDKGKAADTRTPQQKEALLRLIQYLKRIYPSVRQVIGHRDASPDLNHDGKVTPNEWVKQCPCFDAKAAYQNV